MAADCNAEDRPALPKAFEEQLGNISNLDDPLALFEEHYKTLNSLHTPNDTTIITLFLEKATQTFVDDARYRNDPRYLKFWLAYAQRCREPEDIYVFLALQGIAVALASYYEEYSGWLEGKGEVQRALSILKAGVQRGAQPSERLYRRLTEFSEKHGKDLVKKGEVPSYKTEMLKDGALSFEEVRARTWRRAGSILKSTTYTPLVNIPIIQDDHDDLDDLGMGLVDPDELTHISVYRDNTTDLRELAKSLTNRGKENNSNNNYDGNEMVGKKRRTFDHEFDLGEDLEGEVEGRPYVYSRLSLIPEESDGGTQASGLIPSLLRRSKELFNDHKDSSIFTIDFYKKMHETITDLPFKKGSDLILPKLAILRKSIGRDGVGNNNTVSSLSLASGHYFFEYSISDFSLLAIDLEADLPTDSDTPTSSTSRSSEPHSYLLKFVPDLWEAYILSRLAGTPGVPHLSKASRHPDTSAYSRTFYPHTLPLALALALNKVDEKLILFWVREIFKTLEHLCMRRIVHGGILIRNVALRLGSTPVGGTFDPTGGSGWSERGIVMLGYSHSLDMNIFPGDILDSSLLDVYRRRLGDACPVSIPAIDLYSISNLITVLLTDRVMKYGQMWSAVQANVAEALDDRNLSWHGASLCVARAIEVMDECLVKHAAVLPTLKSLLTKLEISLLQSS